MFPDVSGPRADVGTPEHWERTGDEMFRCERCGSSFSPIRVSHAEICPRCRVRDGLSVPLTFAPDSAETSEVDDATAPEPREALRDQESRAE
jgi:hypothetical protein